MSNLFCKQLIGVSGYNQARMNLITDYLWQKQAIITDLQHEFNRRSLLGDYNIDLLGYAFKQENATDDALLILDSITGLRFCDDSS